MDTAELFIMVHRSAVLPKMPIIKCAGGKGLLFSVWNESDIMHVIRQKTNVCDAFVSQ